MKDPRLVSIIQAKMDAADLPSYMDKESTLSEEIRSKGRGEGSLEGGVGDLSWNVEALDRLMPGHHVLMTSSRTGTDAISGQVPQFVPGDPAWDWNDEPPEGTPNSWADRVGPDLGPDSIWRDIERDAGSYAHCPRCSRPQKRRSRGHRAAVFMAALALSSPLMLVSKLFAFPILALASYGLVAVFWPRPLKCRHCGIVVH